MGFKIISFLIAIRIPEIDIALVLYWEFRKCACACTNLWGSDSTLWFCAIGKFRKIEPIKRVYPRRGHFFFCLSASFLRSSGTAAALFANEMLSLGLWSECRRLSLKISRALPGDTIYHLWTGRLLFESFAGTHLLLHFVRPLKILPRAAWQKIGD